MTSSSSTRRPGWQHLGPFIVPNLPRVLRSHSALLKRNPSNLVLNIPSILHSILSNLTYKELAPLEQTHKIFKEALKDDKWDEPLFRLKKTPISTQQAVNSMTADEFHVHPLLSSVKVVRDADGYELEATSGDGERSVLLAKALAGTDDRLGVWPPIRRVILRYQTDLTREKVCQFVEVVVGKAITLKVVLRRLNGLTWRVDLSENLLDEDVDAWNVDFKVDKVLPRTNGQDYSVHLDMLLKKY